MKYLLLCLVVNACRFAVSLDRSISLAFLNELARPVDEVEELGSPASFPFVNAWVPVDSYICYDYKLRDHDAALYAYPKDSDSIYVVIVLAKWGTRIAWDLTVPYVVDSLVLESAVVCDNIADRLVFDSLLSRENTWTNEYLALVTKPGESLTKDGNENDEGNGVDDDMSELSGSRDSEDSDFTEEGQLLKVFNMDRAESLVDTVPGSDWEILDVKSLKWPGVLVETSIYVQKSETVEFSFPGERLRLLCWVGVELAAMVDSVTGYSRAAWWKLEYMNRLPSIVPVYRADLEEAEKESWIEDFEHIVVGREPSRAERNFVIAETLVVAKKIIEASTKVIEAESGGWIVMNVDSADKVVSEVLRATDLRTLDPGLLHEPRDRFIVSTAKLITSSDLLFKCFFDVEQTGSVTDFGSATSNFAPATSNFAPTTSNFAAATLSERAPPTVVVGVLDVHGYKVITVPVSEVRRLFNYLDRSTTMSLDHAETMMGHVDKIPDPARVARNARKLMVARPKAFSAAIPVIESAIGSWSEYIRLSNLISLATTGSNEAGIGSNGVGIGSNGAGIGSNEVGAGSNEAGAGSNGAMENKGIFQSVLAMYNAMLLHKAPEQFVRIARYAEWVIRTSALTAVNKADGDALNEAVVSYGGPHSTLKSLFYSLSIIDLLLSAMRIDSSLLLSETSPYTPYIMWRVKMSRFEKMIGDGDKDLIARARYLEPSSLPLAVMTYLRDGSLTDNSESLRAEHAPNFDWSPLVEFFSPSELRTLIMQSKNGVEKTSEAAVASQLLDQILPMVFLITASPVVPVDVKAKIRKAVSDAGIKHLDEGINHMDIDIDIDIEAGIHREEPGPLGSEKMSTVESFLTWFTTMSIGVSVKIEKASGLAFWPVNAPFVIPKQMNTASSSNSASSGAFISEVLSNHVYALSFSTGLTSGIGAFFPSIVMEGAPVVETHPRVVMGAFSSFLGRSLRKSSVQFLRVIDGQLVIFGLAVKSEAETKQWTSDSSDQDVPDESEKGLAESEEDVAGIFRNNFVLTRSNFVGLESLGKMVGLCGLHRKSINLLLSPPIMDALSLDPEDLKYRKNIPSSVNEGVRAFVMGINRVYSAAMASKKFARADIANVLQADLVGRPIKDLDLIVSFEACEEGSGGSIAGIGQTMASKPIVSRLDVLSAALESKGPGMISLNQFAQLVTGSGRTVPMFTSPCLDLELDEVIEAQNQADSRHLIDAQLYIHAQHLIDAQHVEGQGRQIDSDGFADLSDEKLMQDMHVTQVQRLGASSQFGLTKLSTLHPGLAGIYASKVVSNVRSGDSRPFRFKSGRNMDRLSVGFDTVENAIVIDELATAQSVARDLRRYYHELAETTAAHYSEL